MLHDDERDLQLCQEGTLLRAHQRNEDALRVELQLGTKKKSYDLVTPKVDIHSFQNSLRGDDLLNSASKLRAAANHEIVTSQMLVDVKVHRPDQMESQRIFLPQTNTTSKFFDTDQILKASIDFQKEEAFQCMIDSNLQQENEEVTRVPPKEMYKMGYISSSNASCLEEHGKKFKSLKMTLRQQKAMNGAASSQNNFWNRRKPSGNPLFYSNQPPSQPSLLPDEVCHFIKNQES